MGEVIRYTRDDKMRAAVVYVLTGSPTKAAEEIGCSRITIHDWIRNADDAWIECVDKAREESDKKLPHIFAGVMYAAINRIHEALKDASAVQASQIMTSAFDKRQVISNKPTSINASNKDMEKRLHEIEAMLVSRTKPRRVA